MIGLSPTLPYFFLLIPPVDVAAAKLPNLSRATAPTVPYFGSYFLFSSFYFIDSFNFFFKSSVLKYDCSTNSQFYSLANY